MRHSPTGDCGDQEEMDVKNGTVENYEQKEHMHDTEHDTDNEDKDVEMEDDPSRAEGVLKFEVHNFSKLKDTVLSDPVIIRNLPWRIMVMPRFSSSATGEKVKSLGIFLQCDPEGEGSSWSCQASAKISVINQRNVEETFSRKITHLFFAKENDWGYSNFLCWNDVTDTGKGFIKNDTVIVEISVQADAPHGVFWDSKKLTGYVGLKNQGATCYMNSLLQTLFFTNQLKKAVYQMPTENDDLNKSVALALQRVFYELQHSDKPVGTKKLTKSFGWETLDSFMQHDVQELCRVLLDNMESKMKSTIVEGTIPKLLEGKTTSYIQCLHINYRSTREEPFYDIQLNIKGKKNVYESFKDYVSTEKLEGDNKYDAGDNGLQEAKKGVIFKSLPPVLHLHLLRFQYDPITDTNYKINDRYEFPEHLDLQEFLESPEPTPAKYTLHAVLVHSGDNHGGHYVVYLNPKGDGKWFKFDDDVVSQATKREAIENNFGGYDDEVSVRHCTNAYMLAYIRDSNLAEVLSEVRDEDIPEHLERKFQEEKRLEAQRRKERNEAHLYMDVEVVSEDLFYSWSGNDLFDFENYRSSHFRVRKQMKLSEVYEVIANAVGCGANQVRLWPFQRRSNSTIRPSVMECRAEDKRKIDNINDVEIFNLSEMDPHMLAFLEITSPEDAEQPLPKFDEKNDVLLFFKYYNPKNKTMSYCGHLYVPLCKPPSDLFPVLCRRAGLPTDTRLLLFEEVKPGATEQVQVDKRLDETIQELMDGDILCFQAWEPDFSHYELPTCMDYFRELVYQVEVTFCDKNYPTEPGFTVMLSLKMNYTQLASAVAFHLSVDPMKVQFFKPQMYRDFPGNAIKCTYDGTLRDILALARTRNQRKLYYQILTIPIDVMENKFQFKCSWINSKLRDERELNLFVDKDGTTEHLLREARRHVETVETKQLRLVEIIGNKVIRIVPNDVLLEGLIPQTQRSFRVEEIPEEEIDIGTDATLVPVAHFQKELYNNFGTPFLLKLTEGENISSIRERVQSKLDIPDKEFEKIKFSRVHMGKVDYFPDEPDRRISIRDFQVNAGGTSRPWLGLDHMNKAPKRSRYAYVEKPIKIHN